MSSRRALIRAATRAASCAAGCLLALMGAHSALAASPAVSPGPHAHHVDWVGNGVGAESSVGDRSVSYSTWSLSGDTFIVRYLLPISDAERVAGTDIEVLVQQRLGDYLLAHLAVRTGAQECPAIDQGYDIGKVDPLTVAAGLYGFEIFFRCPSAFPTQVALENHALFDRIPGHVDFARVQINAGPVRLQLFTRQHEVLPIAPAGITRYIGLGADHVLGSLDRLCFLFGTLLLILTRLRARPPRLALAISPAGPRPVAPARPEPLHRRAWLAAALHAIAGLAAGYALSLLAALAGGLAPRERLLDAAIGFLVALLAAGLATRHLARMRLAAGAAAAALLCLAALIALAHGRWPALWLAGAGVFAGCQLTVAQQLERGRFGWLLLPGLFAFLDGFVLPAEVVPMQLPSRAVLPMAVGFDLGALSMELAVLTALSLAIAAVRSWPRTRSLLRYSDLSTDLATTALAAAGVFWMLSRLHG